MIKKALGVVLCLLFCVPDVSAELIMSEFDGNIYVEKSDVKELEELFIKNRYGRFRYLPDDEFPSIFVKSLPTDFQSIESQKYRNELFIRILTPLALKINEELKNERNRLLRLEQKYLRNQTLSPKDIELLEGMAEKYDVFVRNKNSDVRIPEQFNELKMRVNSIPPSIFVAVAAMETDWGFARVANLANSLYKEKVWYTNEGLEPLENKDDGYRFRIFKDLEESMRSFALMFNSDKKFFSVWVSRDQSEKRIGRSVGEDIAYSLAHASNLPNYVGILDYTTAFYDLFSLDKGKLRKIDYTKQRKVNVY